MSPADVPKRMTNEYSPNKNETTVDETWNHQEEEKNNEMNENKGKKNRLSFSYVWKLTFDS